MDQEILNHLLLTLMTCPLKIKDFQRTKDGT